MEIAKSMCGFSPGDADFLRKAMGKKNLEVMERYKEQFFTGSKKKDVPHKIANKIFDQMLQFAAYGFNKSHSVAYALVAYQTAYLKANYPVEFMTALLTSEIGHSAVDVIDKENKLVTYTEEAENMGIEVLGPDVNHSVNCFSIEKHNGKPAIRFALNAVKNVGEGAVETMVLEREEKGKFTSLENFIERLGGRQFNKRVGEALAKSGSFDCFANGDIKELYRAKVLGNVEELFNSKGNKQKENANQDMLFGFEETKADCIENKDIAPLSEHELLKNEKEVLGFYMSGHPLTSLKRRMSMVVSSQIEPIVKGKFSPDSKLRVAGMILNVKKITTKKGSAMAKFELEDLSGSVSVCVFPRKYKEFSEFLVPNTIVAVLGTVNVSTFKGSTSFELFAEEIVAFGDVFQKWGKNLVVSFSDGVLLDEKKLVEIKHIMGKHKGTCPVFFRVNTRARANYVIETTEKVVLEQKLFKEIEKALGEKTWQVESGF